MCFFFFSAGDAVSLLWRDRSSAHQEHRCYGGQLIITAFTAVLCTVKPTLKTNLYTTRPQIAIELFKCVQVSIQNRF